MSSSHTFNYSLGVGSSPPLINSVRALNKFSLNVLVHLAVVYVGKPWSNTDRSTVSIYNLPVAYTVVKRDALPQIPQ